MSQSLFRSFKKLSGMTGTAATEADEFSRIYGLTVVTIPTNMEIARTDNSDVVFKTKDGEQNFAQDTSYRHRNFICRENPIL